MYILGLRQTGNPELFLGRKADTARKRGQVKQVLGTDTSVIETVQFLFSINQIQKIYLLSTKQIEGKIHNYCDGSEFSPHPLFGTCPQALIQLYLMT